MMITKIEHPVPSSRIQAIKAAVTRQLIADGYTVESHNGSTEIVSKLNGCQLPVRLRNSKWADNSLTARIGYRTVSNSPTGHYTIWGPAIYLHESKTGFNTDRIVRSIIKFFTAYRTQLESIRNTSTEFQQTEALLKTLRKDYPGFEFEQNKNSDKQGRITMRIPNVRNPDQIETIVDLLAHHIEVYG